MSRHAYAYAEPGTVDEAVAVLAAHGDDAKIMAGGTALMLLLDQGFVAPAVVVGLRPEGELASLAGIEPRDGELAIGALTTLRSIERSPVVGRSLPGLAEAAHRVASVRIRNQATIGGQLAHADPAQDLPPVLLALDARLEIAAPAGTRSVPLDELAVDVFETSLAPDEIVTRVFVPLPQPSSRMASIAFRPRTFEDYPTVAVAVRLDLDPSGRVAAARIALGAVASTAVRARSAEAALVGSSADAASIDAAVDGLDDVLDPVDDGRASRRYRLAMARLWTRRLLLQASAPAVETSAVA